MHPALSQLLAALGSGNVEGNPQNNPPTQAPGPTLGPIGTLPGGVAGHRRPRAAGGGGGGGVGGATGKGPRYNPVTGSMLTGPNPVITAPFRHLYSQSQVTGYGSRDPHYQFSVGPGGQIFTSQFDWWKPGARPKPRKPLKKKKDKEGEGSEGEGEGNENENENGNGLASNQVLSQPMAALMQRFPGVF